MEWTIVLICHVLDLSDTSQKLHRWTDGWRPSEIIAYNGQWTLKTSQKQWPWCLSKKIVSLTMVKQEDVEKPWKTTRNGETIKIPWGNYDYRLKVVNNHNIKKHRQRWLSSNNRISSDVNVCPKNIGIASHREKKTSPLHRHKKLTIDQAQIGTKCFFSPTYILSSKLCSWGGEAPYLYHHSGNFANLANFGQLWPDNGIWRAT